MNRIKQIKIFLGMIMVVMGLSLSCMLASAHGQGNLKKMSEQELDQMIDRNEKSYAKKSEKQIRLNKAYKSKIGKLRSDAGYGMSKQTVDQINSMMEDVNDNVTKLSVEKDKLSAAKRTLNSQDSQDKRKNDKIRIIRSQKTINQLLSKINRDLEKVIELLD